MARPHTGQMWSNAVRPPRGQVVSLSDLPSSGAEDLTGCTVAFASAAAVAAARGARGAQLWRARGEILGYAGADRTCTLEWRLTLKAAPPALPVQFA
jgi:hypothetical protein